MTPLRINDNRLKTRRVGQLIKLPDTVFYQLEMVIFPIKLNYGTITSCSHYLR